MSNIKFTEVAQDETSAIDVKVDVGATEDYVEVVRRVSGLDLSKPRNRQEDKEFIDAVRRVSGGNLMVHAKRGDSATLLGNAQAGVIEATRRIRYPTKYVDHFFIMCDD